MPSQRKRIGFLPRAEVQNIIDHICEFNKLSQSKVTGLLVEEALTLRGVLNISTKEEALKFSSNSNKSLKIPNELFLSDTQKKNEILDLEEMCKKEEIQMINDYIEYKFFKNIMKKKK